MTSKKRPKKVKVNDKMQKNYVYELTEHAGKNFHKDFNPELTPKEMLQAGVFGGKYMNDCKKEFPKSWFKNAKLSGVEAPRNCNLNYFGICASQPLSVWKEKGWINEKHDPRGWFQWYCRYYRGRRLEKEDKKQISRWRAFKRHLAQVEKNCKKGDINCRKKQRQALLHWAYDSRKI